MAVLLYARNVRIDIGMRTLLNIEEIEIRDGARIGLVGDNGAGKSTLISVLLGERQPDGGVVQRFSRCAVVRQFGEAEEKTQSGAVSGRLGAKEEVHAGISGGEMERIRLARALEMRAPLLMADEPTTNLDFSAREEVEKQLKDHEGALLLVSHDRELLDSVCSEIWHLENGKIRVYPGNYSAFYAQRQRERDFALQEYRAYTHEKARLENLAAGVARQAAHIGKVPKRMGNSEARLHKASVRDNAQEKLQNRVSAIRSRIENLEVKERPAAEQRVKMEWFERSAITSREAIRANRITLRGGEKLLLKGASFTVPTGRRTVIVGENGCGKSTLLRYILQGGYGIKTAPGVKMGYFAQETLGRLRERESVLKNVMYESVLPEHAARTILFRMGFSDRDIEKEICVLSGGERARVVLCALLAGDYNVLLLDEPGNHLDLTALEALEEMLSAYPGTLLLVSHDRRMIDRVAHRLLIFEKGGIRTFEGNYEEYERSRSNQEEEKLEAEMLRMRMAELIGRMAAPRKGDEKEALEAEYDQIAARLRGMEKET
ncbi:MAG: ABC-F type ribosomal protection protein [Clostridia bacterium]|nr:ABC-F type ribosomal protection protein [Clostridia bacterium]